MHSRGCGTGPFWFGWMFDVTRGAFLYYVTKCLNNNVVLAEDEHGRELIVFGTGIGFRHAPYYLGDMRKVQRTFRDVSENMYAVIASLSDEAITVASDIVDIARQELNCSLNPNLAFTLADHIQFTINRIKKGIDIENPLAAQVDFVYPREMEVGRKGLLLLYEVTGIEAPDHEASAIALHIVNGEAIDPDKAKSGKSPHGGLRGVIQSTEAIESVTSIVECSLGVQVDRYSYAYARFTAHLRYLINRLSDAEEREETRNSSLFRQAAEDFSDAYACALAIDEYFRLTHGWQCSDEELLYLMMHINRLQQAGG